MSSVFLRKQGCLFGFFCSYRLLTILKRPQQGSYCTYSTDQGQGCRCHDNMRPSPGFLLLFCWALKRKKKKQDTSGVAVIFLLPPFSEYEKAARCHVIVVESSEWNYCQKWRSKKVLCQEATTETYFLGVSNQHREGGVWWTRMHVPISCPPCLELFKKAKVSTQDQLNGFSPLKSKI